MNHSKSKPVRILHVVGAMNRAGVETWLMHVLRHIDRDRFRFDFLVHTTEPCAYDEEIRHLGSKIIPCLTPSNPWRYAVNFFRAIKHHGPYDIVHSHVHHFSGFVLWLSRMAGVPTRIAHSHNDTSLVDSESGALRSGYLSLTEQLVRKYATIGLACSQKASSALFGPHWQEDPRWRILYYGIDLSPFAETVDPSEVKTDLGIPADTYVVGHVGRFYIQKNHEFLIDIAACLVDQEPDVCLLLIGDGPLRPRIQEKVANLGLQHNVIFAGVRPDVPRLMLGAMDAFVMPSLYEGLGLVLVEAQAAGLPCVISDIVPTEADVIPQLVHRLTVNQAPALWAQKLLELNKRSPLSRTTPYQIIIKSTFNISESARHLIHIYENHYDNGKYTYK